MTGPKIKGGRVKHNAGSSAIYYRGKPQPKVKVKANERRKIKRSKKSVYSATYNSEHRSHPNLVSRDADVRSAYLTTKIRAMIKFKSDLPPEAIFMQMHVTERPDGYSPIKPGTGSHSWQRRLTERHIRHET